ncbi:MAG: hypothetical protein KAT31_01895, partial [Bacteroidales bacterium]|nr:hypothetical protein [Bacteroidales bacterium]
MKTACAIFLVLIMASNNLCQTQEIPIETVIQTGHYAEVTAVAFSPNGHFAATGSADKTIKLWEVTTGREIRSYLGHVKGIRTLAFGPDNKYLASIDQDYLLRIWDIPSSRLIREMEMAGDRFLSVVFHPGGESIITGTDKNHAIEWSIHDGSEIRRFRPG